MKINISSRKGFSLVEVVIAIGLVAVLLTTFMAVFGPAQKNINRALGAADANRLVSTLENEMAILRPNEIGDFTIDSNFEKAFQWISDSHDEKTAIVVFQYQAIPDKEVDGRLAPAITEVSSESALPGVDYITQTVAKRIGDVTEDELSPGVVTGKVYVVRMTQLINAKDINDTDGDGDRNESFLQTITGYFVDPDVTGIWNVLNNPEGRQSVVESVSAADVEDAYITLQAEFFPLNNNLHAYVTGNGTWDFDKLGTPVATQNIAVRR